MTERKQIHPDTFRKFEGTDPVPKEWIKVLEDRESEPPSATKLVQALADEIARLLAELAEAKSRAEEWELRYGLLQDESSGRYDP